MGVELEAVKTPVAPNELFVEMVQAWRELFGVTPRRESVVLLIAHWGLETGNGRSMWCYNLGNVKAQPGGPHDYCFYACNELLGTPRARSLQASDPEHAKVTSDRPDGKSWIWFYPKHPYSCFRAYPNLHAGVVAHLQLINKRFSTSWPAVIAGDPNLFCHMLKQQGYYTADEAAYTKGVVGAFNNYTKRLAEVAMPEPPSLYERLTSATFSESPLHTPVLDEECHIHSPFSLSLEAP
jgi:hypothetical protein